MSHNDDCGAMGNEGTLGFGPMPQPASTITRTVDNMVMTMPAQPLPGFQRVTCSNDAGTTTIPEGLGVLAMIERRELCHDVDPNHLLIHTLPNYAVLLVLGAVFGLVEADLEEGRDA